jgi:ABC-type sugar transport system ATPase subunit
VHIELRDVTKRYGRQYALRNVRFTAESGRVHALLGHNGAGKSTLVKVLSGAVSPDGGEIVIDGEARELRSPAEASAVGIALVHQETQIFPDLTVAENITIARTFRSGPGPFAIHRRRLRVQHASALLHELGVQIPVDAQMRSLNFAEQKLAQVARGLSTHAKVLLLDEPTASLGPAEAERIIDLARRLRDRGLSIILISHNIGEALAVADDVTVLRDGKVALQCAARETRVSDIVDLISDGAISHDGASSQRSKSAVNPKKTRVVLQASNITSGSTKDVSAEFRAGEIALLTGLVGSGARIFASCLAEAIRHDGQVRVNGALLKNGRRPHAVSHGVAYLAEDRKASGVIPDLSVGKNLAVASLDRLCRRLWVNNRKIRAEAVKQIEVLAIRPPRHDVPISALSGGNQQKTLIGRWLATNPRVMVVEDPTHGVDIGAKAEIKQLLRAYADEGGSVIISSLDVDELIDIVDVVHVFRHGRIVTSVPGHTSPKEILRYAVT